MLALPRDYPLTCRRLSRDDLAALQSLCERCRDYHEMLSAAPARPDEALDILEGHPPLKELRDKHVFGLYRAELLVGALELLADFRVPDEWYLGLLLFAPDERSQGHGAVVLDALVPWLKAQGVASVRLAVADQNAGGRRFWERHGFILEKLYAPRPMGTRETALAELVRTL